MQPFSLHTCKCYLNTDEPSTLYMAQLCPLQLCGAQSAQQRQHFIIAVHILINKD